VAGANELVAVAGVFAGDRSAVRPRLLDLFCGAGGAATGYHRAGFDVVGVDNRPQPHYPFEFYQWDITKFWTSSTPSHFASFAIGFDAIHASPPCQAYTAYRRTGRVGDHPDLIDATRDLLWKTGLPWVIENVEGAPLKEPLMLCGTMFDPPMEIQRHRFFESNWPIDDPLWPCRHLLNGKDRYPGGRSRERTGSSRGLVRATVEIGSWDIPLERQQQAMGIDWMKLDELSEAIPPAYTELIGHQLLAHVKALEAERTTA
jgi:DNA (cytosine-5)-methyltransferase 1